ncbi:MAG: hypothetical protein WAW52_00640 [Methanothrix sp.]
MLELPEATGCWLCDLREKDPSRPGYLSQVRVRHSGAGILSFVARADGFVVVSEEKEGLEAGKTVEVILFE